jgi:toxin ParE1/3/4
MIVTSYWRSSRSGEALVLSRDAVADIAAIGRYSHRIWGAEQARRYSQRLTDRLISLKQKVRPGRARSDIDPSLRGLKSDRHVIYFTLDDERVLVVRILHQSMNPAVRIAAGIASLGRGGE